MSTKSRDIFPNNIYHVYNRSVEKRKIFYTEKDYNKFLERIIYYKYITNVRILAYSILPNHFHFLLEEPSSTRRVPHPAGWLPAISKFISLLSNSYTKYFNYNKDHSGRLFQGPFKSKLVDSDAYLQSVFVYVNLNPLKHRIVNDINDWQYTSHHDFLSGLKSKTIDDSEFIDANYYKRNIAGDILKIKNIDIEFD